MPSARGSWWHEIVPDIAPSICQRQSLLPSGLCRSSTVRSTMRTFTPIMCWKNSALVPGLPSPNTLGDASMPTQNVGHRRGSLTTPSKTSTGTPTWKSFIR